MKKENVDKNDALNISCTTSSENMILNSLSKVQWSDCVNAQFVSLSMLQTEHSFFFFLKRKTEIMLWEAMSFSRAFQIISEL